MNDLSEQPRRIRKFNPGTFQSDEELIKQFVVREAELALVLDSLRGSAGSASCQHVLLVAPRGRGKTMMLARIAAELRTDSDLSEQFLPVRFMEESQEIFDLDDFWLELLFYLSREHGVGPDLSRELRARRDDLAAKWRGRELEERARAAVLEVADRLGKKLVLMIENLQALCRDMVEDFGWKLRGVLQSDPQIILLATATTRFRELDDVDHAFFELFRIVRLEPLDTAECNRLWRAVTGDEVSEREIRPLEILTGGDPRLLVIIAEFAQHHSVRQLMEDLVRLIDDHTEYFRAHLEGFAKTERRTYLALVDLWKPSTTGEVVKRARLGTRTVSTMLGRLVKRGAVVIENRDRKRFFVAAQRLYSIYYKLRRERDEAAIVRNMIHFMAVFYTDEELPKMAGKLKQEAAQSLAIREGIERAIAEEPAVGRIFPREEWPAISQTSERFTGVNGKRVEDGNVTELQSRVVKAMVHRVITQGQLGDTQAEIATYDEVIERYGSSDVPELQARVAMALVFKGIRQGQLGDARAEVATYDDAIEQFRGSDVPELQARVAVALLYKGITQGQLGDARAAMATYDEVTERYGDSDVPELQVQVAKALVNKGVTQGQLGDTEAATATFNEVAERFGDSDVPELQVQVAMALVNKGITQGQLGDARAEMATYDDVIGRYGGSDVPELQAHVAVALFYKGITQGQLGDARASVATYRTSTGDDTFRT